MSIESDFYKNRILWKAKKNNLFKNGCLEFQQLGLATQELIRDVIKSDEEPILVFWFDESQWTVVTEKSVTSKFQGIIQTIELNKINKEVRMTKEVKINNADKISIEYMFVGKELIQIWVPNGARFFALMSILNMFPLNLNS